MAKKGPDGPNRTSFKVGHTPNPKVKRPSIWSLDDVNRIGAVQLSRLVSKFFNMSLDQLDEVAADRSGHAIENYIATMITTAIYEKDPSKAKELLDRMAGRPKEQTVVTEDRDEEVRNALDGIPRKTVREFLREVSAA